MTIESDKTIWNQHWITLFNLNSSYRKFTIDIPGRQNETTTLTSFFGKSSSLKLKLDKVLYKLIEVLFLEKIYSYSSPKSKKIPFFKWFSSTLALNSNESYS